MKKTIVDVKALTEKLKKKHAARCQQARNNIKQKNIEE